MFKFVILFAILAVAAAAPKKEEKVHVISIKSESEGESSQWRKDNIEKHVEHHHGEHHEEHHGGHHEEHHGEHHEEHHGHHEEQHGEHHEEHHGGHHEEHQEEHHGKHHEEHKPEIKKIITYKSESEGESKQWRKDNIEKHVEHGHGH